MARTPNENQPVNPIPGVSPETESAIRALLALLPQNQAPVSNPRLDSILDKIDESLQVAKNARQKQEADEAEKKRIDFESRKQNAMAMAQKRQEEIANQTACLHLQPNMTTNVIGQRGHFGNVHYFCQTCAKYWKDNEIPHHLKPANVNHVGGPV